MSDLELKAMETVLLSIKDLDQPAQMRVMNWVKERLGIVGNSKTASLTFESEVPLKNIGLMETLADFFSAANPKSDAERALVVATYLQTKQNLKELTGREINQELQHLGHKVGNITLAINKWKSKKPQLMIQTRKEGTSQQAQKKYRVTQEGIVTVEKMLSGISVNE